MVARPRAKSQIVDDEEDNKPKQTVSAKAIK
jgi:hypothetical protein